MHDLLRKHERSALHEKLADLTLYKVLRAPCSQWQVQLRWLSPEDVCLECLRVLDLVKEDPDEASFELRPLWTDIYNDLRQQAPSVAADEDVCTATDITFYAPLLMLSYAAGHFYTELTGELTAQWQEHAADPTRVIESFTPTVARLGGDKLSRAVDEYMASDEFLSDELDEIISELVEPNSSLASLNEPGKAVGGQLTNRQLVILMENLLGVVAGNSQAVNAKAFADFLAKVSGKSAGSIRQSIPQGGIDYNPEGEKKAASIADDVTLVAALIEPFAPKKAQEIRNLLD